MDEHTAVNQKIWDELAPVHAASSYYDVESFLRGDCTLGDIELEEVGDVAGKDLLHLMCHFGMDALSWARRGANVTGLDFSAEAVRIAQDLSGRTGVAAEFVCADVMTAADRLDRTFDIVYLSRGVLMWIQDVAALAQVCARLLKPGGVFYLLDIHPLALAVEQGADAAVVRGNYFHTPEPVVVVADGSYAVQNVGLTHQESREWTHPLGEVVTALIDAGIRIEFLHEFPNDGADGAPVRGTLPGLYSVRGIRE